MAPMLSKTISSDEFSSPLTTDEKIRVFESRVRTWFIEIAENVTAINGSGYITVSPLLSYFEMIGQFVKGEKSDDARGQEFFLIGFKKVYPSGIKSCKPSALYSKARCGLYHNLFPYPGLLLQDLGNETFRQEGPDLIIDPKNLVRDIRAHLTKFHAELTNADATDYHNIRYFFENAFDLLYGTNLYTGKASPSDDATSIINTTMPSKTNATVGPESMKSSGVSNIEQPNSLADGDIKKSSN